MKIINLFAGPGAGKSTTRAGVFHKLKLENFNVEEVTEYAKELTWDRRHNVLNNDQLYVFAKQNRALNRLSDHNLDWIITDSPLFLSLIYRRHDYYPEHFQELVLEVWNSYDNLNFFIQRAKKYNPLGRQQSEEEAKELDRYIKQQLILFKIPFIEVPGTLAAVDIIIAKIKSI